MRTGNYKLHEIATNEWYNLNDEEINIEIKFNETKDCIIENELKKGSIKVIKVDKDNKNVKLQGVKFNVLDKNGKILETIITDKDGEATTSKYPIKDYDKIYLQEIQTKDNYKLNNIKKEVALEANQIKTVIIENEKKKGQVEILKVDKDNNEIKLEGVTFEIYNEKGEIVDTIVTNKEGKATSKLLPIDPNYVMKETITNEMYKLSEETKPIKLEVNQIKILKFENEKKKGKIKAIKLDKDNNEIKLQGVTFKIYDEKGNVVDTIVTNRDGEAISKELPIDQKYTIKETITGNLYILSKETKTVTLEENQIKTLKFENEKKKGKIEVVKIDKDNKEIKLEGVVFEILGKDGKIVDTITTNKEGKATSKKLPIDETYTIREKQTKQEYVLTTERKKVTLKQNEIKSIVFENEKKKGQIEVVKIDKDNNEVKLEGVVFEILDKNKKVVDTIKTNKEGKATSKKIPIDQKYIVREKSTRNEYVLSKENKTVTLKENEIKSIKFENEKKKGKIEIVKIDKDDNEEKLEGVIFEILDENKNVVDTITTNKDGKATSKKLPIDETYTIREKKTKQEYVLTTETKKITLEENKIKSVTFKNEKKKGKIKVVKIDKDNNEVKIEGVTFEIFDKDGTIVDTIVTDKEGTAISKLLPIDNEYLIKEKETAEEYVLSDKEEKLVLEENEIKTIVFENEKKKGNINILKVSNGYSKLLDIEDNTSLSNAKFEVIDEGGNIIGIYETNEKGLIEIKELPYGKYTIYEVESPAGFLKDAESQTIFIDKDGKVIDVTFKDTPIQPELPKTGESNQLNMFIISVMTIVSTLILIKKIKNGGIENDRSNKYKN